MTIFSRLKAAYGGGYRAGRAEPDKIQAMKNGAQVSYLVFPTCPFTLRRQFILATLWHEGYHTGQLERIHNRGRSYAHG